MSLAGKVVLTIDDDEAFRLLVRKILEAQGMRVREAASLELARAQLTQELPDIILLDLNLNSGQRGGDFLAERKSSAAWARIPVVVCSAENEADAIRRCISAGADDYLLKPIKQTWLIQRMLKHTLKHTALLKTFRPEEAPALELVIDAQLVGLGEGHGIFRSQAKFAAQARAQFEVPLLQELAITARELRVDEDSRGLMQGLYDTRGTLLGITEREAASIRKAKTNWRGP